MNTVTDSEGQRHILSVPITQHATSAEKEVLQNEPAIALRCKDISNDVLAVIENPTFYENRKEELCTKTFGTRSLKHQKIARIEAQGDWLVSGETRFC
jgi:ATP sulfurylase